MHLQIRLVALHAPISLNELQYRRQFEWSARLPNSAYFCGYHPAFFPKGEEMLIPRPHIWRST